MTKVKFLTPRVMLVLLGCGDIDDIVKLLNFIKNVYKRMFEIQQTG